MILVYHGTTEEQMRSIKAHGLRKGTYVAANERDAEMYAERRAAHVDHPAVVLIIEVRRSDLTAWKRNRKDFVGEARLRESQTEWIRS